jgi:hypothetical protein
MKMREFWRKKITKSSGKSKNHLKSFKNAVMFQLMLIMLYPPLFVFDPLIHKFECYSIMRKLCGFILEKEEDDTEIVRIFHIKQNKSKK